MLFKSFFYFCFIKILHPGWDSQCIRIGENNFLAHWFPLKGFNNPKKLLFVNYYKILIIIFLRSILLFCFIIYFKFLIFRYNEKYVFETYPIQTLSFFCTPPTASQKLQYLWCTPTTQFYYNVLQNLLMRA